MTRVLFLLNRNALKHGSQNVLCPLAPLMLHLSLIDLSIANNIISSSWPADKGQRPSSLLLPLFCTTLDLEVNKPKWIMIRWPVKALTLYHFKKWRKVQKWEMFFTHSISCCDQMPDRKSGRKEIFILAYGSRGTIPAWQGRHGGKSRQTTDKLHLYSSITVGTGNWVWLSDFKAHLL